ncbi:glutathione S-transferase family protein [Novosphingobium sp. AP12]|uniref:glutathione S-transferase family protein n=1 Tax=Novosphingobium sp. AP12 TaxID=1144305 RepID=UPI000271FB7D|nr:glutathione S-transferase family protein [Novosphingobium sp. AP12]EJL24084.1 glutathione S-transferase [Novosphingobium sp. AP12]
MTYTLITANRNYSSWSLRPWVLMKALGIPFEDELEQFTMPVNYDAFRSFSPTGQVPVLIDEERTIWDSLGIALYLADRHPGVWPANEDARTYAQSAVCEMHGGFSALRGFCTMNVGVRVKPRPMDGQLVREIYRVREIFEEGLSRFGGPWLAGPEFTVLDAFYAPVAFRVRTYGLDVGRGQAWVDAVLAHPAMRQWEEEALAEEWREESHEAELAAAGEIIADYRTGG